MDSRFAAVAALVVGVSVALVAGVEYVLGGLDTAPFDPFATGVFVVVAGLLLTGSGALALSAKIDHLALRAATVVGVFTLAAVVFQPEILLFGGVFWLALVSFGLIAAGSYRTLVHVSEGSTDER